MGDARIRTDYLGREVQFIVVGDGLAFGDQEDGMWVTRLRLQAANMTIVIGS